MKVNFFFCLRTNLIRVGLPPSLCGILLDLERNGKELFKRKLNKNSNEKLTRRNQMAPSRAASHTLPAARTAGHTGFRLAGAWPGWRRAGGHPP